MRTQTQKVTAPAAFFIKAPLIEHIRGGLNFVHENNLPFLVITPFTMRFYSKRSRIIETVFLNECVVTRGQCF